MRIKLPGCHPVHLIASFAHWEPNGTSHGPRSNPRLIAATLCALFRDNVDSRHLGFRLWLYFRGGYAFFIDAIVDRRAAPVPA